MERGAWRKAENEGYAPCTLRYAENVKQYNQKKIRKILS
jgi:hypothetical protein